MSPQRHKSSRSQGRIPTFGELQAAPVMRITPDLHQRSRKKSLHTSRQKFLVPQFSASLHNFSKWSVFRNITVLARNDKKRHGWRSRMVLKPLAIDSTLNSTLDDIFTSHFRKRSLAKMGKFPKKKIKNVPCHYL